MIFCVIRHCIKGPQIRCGFADFRSGLWSYSFSRGITFLLPNSPKDLSEAAFFYQRSACLSRGCLDCGYHLDCEPDVFLSLYLKSLFSEDFIKLREILS